MTRRRARAGRARGDLAALESAEPVRFANLGDTETVVSSRTRIVGDAKDEREKYLKLNGVKPAASRARRGGSATTRACLGRAAAPGLARASALGSRAAKTEKKTDTPWGVGARSDASTTRALRAAFDPESKWVCRAPRRARRVTEVRRRHRFGARPGQVRELPRGGGAAER